MMTSCAHIAMIILVLLPEAKADVPTSVPPTPSHLRTSVTPLASEDGKNGLKDINKQVNDLCSKLYWSSWSPSTWLRWKGIVAIGSNAVPAENKEMFDKVTSELNENQLYYPLLAFLDNFNTNPDQVGLKQTRDAGLALARNTNDPNAMRDETITLDRNALIMLHDMMHRSKGLLPFLVKFVKTNTTSKLDLTFEANLLQALEPIRYPYVDRVCDALRTSELGDLVFTIRAAMDVSAELEKNPESTELQTEEHYYVYQREVLAKRVVDTMLGPVSMSDRTKMADAIYTYYTTAPNIQLWEPEEKRLALELIARMRGQAGPK